ncbi:MAG TPA: ATP-binding protein, partial [Nocardioidaceae bacterium]|nr:ATP-binding protein [Nocardioidaceae bacterium]
MVRGLARHLGASGVTRQHLNLCWSPVPTNGRRPPGCGPCDRSSRTCAVTWFRPPRPWSRRRAHHGALFLDEFPLFGADIVEALRQPLESGEITIARGEESVTFPARAMVVLA